MDGKQGRYVLLAPRCLISDVIITVGQIDEVVDTLSRSISACRDTCLA